MKISKDNVDLARYSADESRMAGGHADRVVWPDNAAELGEMLSGCSERGEPVTVSGAGTGVVGGRVPFGGTIVATDRCKRIAPIRALGPRRASVHVESGVTLKEVREAVQAEGWMFPPDPTEWSAQIGGMLATNASGARGYTFGSSRNWVEAIDVVLATGESATVRRGEHLAEDGAFHWPVGPRELRVPVPDWPHPRTTKHAAGYLPGADDLVDLFVGSEGTLGVIAGATLRLIRAPESMLAGMLLLAEPSAALGIAAAVRRLRGDPAGIVRPWSLELLDESALDLLRREAPGRKDFDLPAGCRAIVSFEQPVDGTGSQDMLLEAWSRLAEQHGAIDVWIANEARDAARMRAVRHAVPVAINETNARRGVAKLSTDSAVPHGQFAAFVERARAELDKAGVEHAIFGHLGDSHLHINLMPDSPQAWPAASRQIEALDRHAVRLGGTVAAEHGIGKLKRERLKLLYGDGVLARMAAIKKALDPSLILGRGNIFEAD